MSTSKLGVTEGSGANIATHSFSEDSVTKHVERVAPGTGILTVPGTINIPDISTKGIYPTVEYLYCSGKSRIILKSLFSSYSCNGITARLVFYDDNTSIIGYSAEFGINNLRIGTTDIDATEWTVDSDFTTGDYIVPTTSNDHYYKETGTGGTGGSSEPTWPTTGGDVTDGDCTWTDQGTIQWYGDLAIIANELGASKFKIRTSSDLSDGTLDIYSGAI